MREKKDIMSMTLEELKQDMKSLELPAYRGEQLFTWLHEKRAGSFSEMTNLPQKLREALTEQYTIRKVTIVQVQISKIDGTRKYLFSLEDGNVIESVFMRYEHGNSVCVSSQVGCRMGCRFCASTMDGLVRNLTAGEMLGQVYGIEEDTGERVSHVVMMGSGEPLDNYSQAVQFIRIISHEKGRPISQRNITLSTCGLALEIERLAEEGLAVTLALSLHSADQKTREQLMPIAKKYSLKEVLQACQTYFQKTGRRITLEYSLIAGENDSREAAEKLAKLAEPLHCHINLIPVNPVKERKFRQSDKKVIENFKNKLEKYGRNVTIRREMGRDIEGACGQLRRSFLEKDKVPLPER